MNLNIINLTSCESDHKGHLKGAVVQKIPISTDEFYADLDSHFQATLSSTFCILGNFAVILILLYSLKTIFSKIK